MNARIPSILAASIVVSSILACSGGDPDNLLPSDPVATEDPLKGGNCGKSHSPHCADAGAADADPGAPAVDSGSTAADAGTPAVDAGSAPVDAAPPPPATCTSFTYSAWGACQPSGTQTRTVLTSSPTGCTGGSPVVSQPCTYVDGTALYTQYCAGCHGTSKKGSTATAIQSAIDTNKGGMGSLSFLTAAQVAAIAAAP
jgi:hypothetical protein